MRFKNGELIQSFALNPKMGVTSPYEVQDTDRIVEFATTGLITVSFSDGSSVVDYPVQAGMRYAIDASVVSISTDCTFSIG